MIISSSTPDSTAGTVAHSRGSHTRKYYTSPIQLYSISRLTAHWPLRCPIRTCGGASHLSDFFLRSGGHTRPQGSRPKSPFVSLFARQPKCPFSCALFFLAPGKLYFGAIVKAPCTADVMGGLPPAADVMMAETSSHKEKGHWGRSDALTQPAYHASQVEVMSP